MPGRAMYGARTVAVEIVRFEFETKSCGAVRCVQTPYSAQQRSLYPNNPTKRQTGADAVLVVSKFHRAPYDV